MNLDEEVKNVIISTLKISPDKYSESLGVGSIPEWDSIGHVNLLQALESKFNVAFDVGDAIEVEDVSDLVSLVEKYLASGAPVTQL